jgi:hypothetical protein
MKAMHWLRACVVAVGCLAGAAMAQVNIDVSSPAIASITASMQQRHAQLAPHYASGAVGLTRDGRIELRDANALPLAQRQAVAGLVAQENGDRAALYREIARANGRPEWENDVRDTFARRWIDKAQPGWWVQGAGGWARK